MSLHTAHTRRVPYVTRRARLRLSLHGLGVQLAETVRRASTLTSCVGCANLSRQRGSGPSVSPPPRALALAPRWISRGNGKLDFEALSAAAAELGSLALPLRWLESETAEPSVHPRAYNVLDEDDRSLRSRSRQPSAEFSRRCYTPTDPALSTPIAIEHVPGFPREIASLVPSAHDTFLAQFCPAPGAAVTRKIR